jgi:NADP-dependent 3-hydroxy acid dehydrogenase YdfG
MPAASRPVAVVTGASSGIGAATARRLVADGFDVVGIARRRDRLAELAGVRAVVCDVTDEAAVAALAAIIPRVDALVHCAGGAFGLEPVERADLADWRAMYEINVLAVVSVTQALLPALEAGGGGQLVLLGSTAGHITYEGGGGYTAAKHAAAAVVETLRLELNGRPVRLTEVAPGMVMTPEFSLNRFRGDQAKADAVYAGVDRPLVAEDIADIVAWVISRPAHVNVDLLVVRPVAQAAQHKVHRGPIVPD